MDVRHLVGVVLTCLGLALFLGGVITPVWVSLQPGIWPPCHGNTTEMAVGTKGLWEECSRVKLKGQHKCPEDKLKEKPENSNGAGQPSSSNGTGQPSSSNGTGQPSSSNGTGQPSSSNGTGKPSSSNGTGQPSSSNGTGQPSSSNGTGQPSSSNGTGQPNSSNGTEQPSSPNGTEQPSSPNGTEQPSSLNGTEQPSTSDGTPEHPRCPNGLGQPIWTYIGMKGHTHAFQLTRFSVVLGLMLLLPGAFLAVTAACRGELDSELDGLEIFTTLIILGGAFGGIGALCYTVDYITSHVSTPLGVSFYLTWIQTVFTVTGGVLIWLKPTDDMVSV
ncbi:paternally-expressed gene 3 protein-like [Branchiostoma floridae]|uniref:Paternally-expressed gene 3 protein-like n=1 Tax=Branchiostoma floridae TaxID=7739 RepID=A0A9J7KW43_BRAFL|nr:paternally-expressed gene 3 protein-like [Branchiostoma floridae]